MKATHRLVDGKWVDLRTGQEDSRHIQRFHEIAESGEAPSTPHISTKTQTLLRRIAGADSFSDAADLGISFDRVSRPRPKAKLKLKMPEEFESRLVFADDSKGKLSKDPGKFQVEEGEDGKIVVQRKEEHAAAVEKQMLQEQPDEWGELGGDQPIYDGGGVDLGDLQQMAKARAEERYRERRG